MISFFAGVFVGAAFGVVVVAILSAGGGDDE